MRGVGGEEEGRRGGEGKGRGEGYDEDKGGGEEDERYSDDRVVRPFHAERNPLCWRSTHTGRNREGSAV